MARNLKDKIIVFNDDQTCEMVAVKDISDQAIETERGLFYLDSVTKHLDIRNGNLLYCVNVDLPARVEAQKLRELRRSTALKRMMEFNIQDKTDWMKYFPYFIIILLILFK
ncbi:hypothetical protein [Brevibacillus reuszeri]|uniref:hypothetical protein n=1 Tax=Brevibacillus reuszeri TaxID=54915 RepID=UPI000CCC300A|nr:hypothetical protein [Brevibacillus reuszeri]